MSTCLMVFSMNCALAFQFGTSEKNERATNNERSIEKNVSYDKAVLRNRLDYKLVHGEKGKFILKFDESQHENLDVRIYDVIGNLIQTDKFTQEQGTQKEYDFSGFDTKIYVVKVSNQREDVVKKINI